VSRIELRLFSAVARCGSIPGRILSFQPSQLGIRPQAWACPEKQGGVIGQLGKIGVAGMICGNSRMMLALAGNSGMMLTLAGKSVMMLTIAGKSGIMLVLAGKRGMMLAPAGKRAMMLTLAGKSGMMLALAGKSETQLARAGKQAVSARNGMSAI
jgi:hypothetical protein